MVSALVMAVFSVTSLTACDSDRLINAEELPKGSQDFIKTHFPDCSVMRVQYDGVDKDYDVNLDCSAELEFNKNGEWKSVDCYANRVPDAIIPSAILDYVKSNYAQNYIVQIEKERTGYDVELNSDVDLRFNSNGEFVRVDY